MAANQNSRNFLVHRWLVAVSIVLFIQFILPSQSRKSLASADELVGLGAAQSCMNMDSIWRSAFGADKIMCGRVEFLKELGTGANYLGLNVCGEGRLLIFKVRPRELYNYYQFYNVTVASGPSITTDLGQYNLYITNFKDYLPIQNCLECGRTIIPAPVELLGTSGTSEALVFPTTIPATASPIPTRTLSPTPIVPTLTFTSLPSSTNTPLTPTSIATEKTSTDTPAATALMQLPSDETENLEGNSAVIFGIAIAAFILFVTVSFFYVRRIQRF